MYPWRFSNFTYSPRQFNMSSMKTPVNKKTQSDLVLNRIFCVNIYSTKWNRDMHFVELIIFIIFSIYILWKLFHTNVATNVTLQTDQLKSLNDVINALKWLPFYKNAFYLFNCGIYNYHCHKMKFWWRYCFTSVCLSLSVCLSVYLLAGFRKNYWTKLDQILTEYFPKYRIEPINFSEVKVKYQGHHGVKRFRDKSFPCWSDLRSQIYRSSYFFFIFFFFFWGGEQLLPIGDLRPRFPSGKLCTLTLPMAEVSLHSMSAPKNRVIVVLRYVYTLRHADDVKLNFVAVLCKSYVKFKKLKMLWFSQFFLK